jgi:hypothetical protein
MSSFPRLRIGLVTSRPEKIRDYFPSRTEPELVPTEPPFAPDDQLLVEELRRHGHSVQAVVWGGEVAGLAGTVDRLVVRSPWDYTDSDDQRQRFLRWLGDLDRAGLAVDNHPRVMAWLADKRYLKDLEAVGVPIVPTQVVPRGETLDLVAQFKPLGPLVVKPCISAAGVGLVFLESRTAAAGFQAEFEARCRKWGYLVQPFVPEVRTSGEWSLVYLGGTCSHAVHKQPAAGTILVHAEQGGSLRFADPPTSVRAVGDLVLARLREAFGWRQGPGDPGAISHLSTCARISSSRRPGPSCPNARASNLSCSFGRVHGAFSSSGGCWRKERDAEPGPSPHPGPAQSGAVAARPGHGLLRAWQL